LPEGISVTIMAYSEVASLEGVVREILGALASLGRPYEVLIVDDGSTDGTGALADRLAGALPGVRVIHHATNQGLGGVYRTGFSESRQELLTFFPADGQFRAAIIGQFLPLIDESDFVLGYLPPQRRAPVARLLSWTERSLYRLLFGVLPRFQGILMFRRTTLERISLTSAGRGWAVLMELLIRASRAGYRMRSVPIDVRPRASGASKVQNLRTIASSLVQLLELRLRLWSR
jgi:glycosyltransferase involved in cell wall biosynthesis